MPTCLHKYLLTTLFVTTLLSLSIPASAESLIIEVKHADPEELKTVIQELFPNESTVSTLDNRLIINTVDERSSEILDVIEQLDVEKKLLRVEITATIPGAISSGGVFKPLTVTTVPGQAIYLSRLRPNKQEVISPWIATINPKEIDYQLRLTAEVMDKNLVMNIAYANGKSDDIEVMQAKLIGRLDEWIGVTSQGRQSQYSSHRSDSLYVRITLLE